MGEIAIWRYTTKPQSGGDARKFVTLEQQGMVWVGIRYWNDAQKCWWNGSEPEKATVQAWANLPEPARGWFDRGILRAPDQHPDEKETRP